MTGWKRIADETGARHWYYFGEDGRLVRNADTPDGFRVNGDGVFAGISQKGVEQAFAAAEKAKESAQQAYERNYYAELRAKAAEEAAKQCGRGRIPTVTALDSFEEAVERAAEADVPA